MWTNHSRSKWRCRFETFLISIISIICLTPWSEWFNPIFTWSWGLSVWTLEPLFSLKIPSRNSFGFGTKGNILIGPWSHSLPIDILINIPGLNIFSVSVVGQDNPYKFLFTSNGFYFIIVIFLLNLFHCRFTPIQLLLICSLAYFLSLRWT